MKNTIKIIAAFLFLISTSCKAQQMVQIPEDTYKLKANEQQFINKPLKDLLKEIKPEIKLVMGTIDSPSYFSFRFQSREELNKKPLDGTTIGLFVYVKEPLDWNFDKRSKGKEYEWSKEDVEKYGNLTVIRIKVTGNKK
ncbi:hypothetical protein SGQ44_13415 [Flavobacterium sp. Fl-77]|uniref:Uncharacterized protein n=1 Tax=Flavobacterium flavipigmentatum TaxID=2893884 RepID=A0AAJ2VXD7_9FLAO|nr:MULTISPECIES: hypothetical protein [unclassified Flavobacterium]MDX6183169.1 hypothetical protein [Flavobacterium sp. Fl-33]MDX6186762.1 hypothetical protein [Flavobacterium sp. Fl-77]UFH40416.1 hypothetical protein LNP22_09095 [Flavobacterium sp. F-70]